MSASHGHADSCGVLQMRQLCQIPHKTRPVTVELYAAKHQHDSHHALHGQDTVVGVQVKQQVEDFKEREARTAQAEQHASSYSAREAALTSRQQNVTALEDKAQQANAAAEYARKEADAMWNKQKVGDMGNSTAWLSSMCSLTEHTCRPNQHEQGV